MRALFVVVVGLTLAACGTTDVVCVEKADGKVVCVDQQQETICHQQQASHGGCGCGGGGMAIPLEELANDIKNGTVEVTVVSQQATYCEQYPWSALCPMQGMFEFHGTIQPDPTAD